MKPTVLILCTGNSCRSHLAEGILRAAAGDLVDVQSAGSKPAGYVHPLAIRVMKEIGIDISGHRSKHLNEFLQKPIETVITVCGNADQACPMFPGQVNRYHWGFDDPAHATGTEEEKLAVFRRVRDEMKWCLRLTQPGGRTRLGARKLYERINSDKDGRRCSEGSARGLWPNSEERRVVLRAGADVLRLRAGGIREPGQAYWL